VRLAAERAAAESTKDVRVIPTESMPEGLTAALPFDPTAGADDILRELVDFVAQSLMELDVENRCGASARRTQRRTNAFA